MNIVTKIKNLLHYLWALICPAGKTANLEAERQEEQKETIIDKAELLKTQIVSYEAYIALINDAIAEIQREQRKSSIIITKIRCLLQYLWDLIGLSGKTATAKAEMRWDLAEVAYARAETQWEQKEAATAKAEAQREQKEAAAAKAEALREMAEAAAAKAEAQQEERESYIAIAKFISKEEAEKALTVLKNEFKREHSVYPKMGHQYRGPPGKSIDFKIQRKGNGVLT